MARLNSSLHYSLTEKVLNDLFNKKIYTVTEFLSTDTKLLTQFTNLTYKEILDIRKEIIDKFSAKVYNGATYYKHLLKTTILIPTHIKNFDKLLDGGLLSGHIYEICGFPASGKTQLCLTIAANISQFIKKPVYFIDTKNDFSAVRLQNILEKRDCNEGMSAQILNRIKVKQVHDQFNLMTALHDIKTELSNNISCSTIIIDSLPGIFYHTGDYNKTQSLMNHFVNILRFISIEFHVSIIVTNILIKDDSTVDNCTTIVVKPGLGSYWNSICNTRVQLTKNESNIKLSIIKCCTVECGKNYDVTITESGVI